MRDDANDIAKRVRRLERRGQIVAGEFVDGADDPLDDLRITVPEWDDAEHTFGPVVWQAGADGTLPEQGDQCVAVEASDGQWWVLAWTPA